jgi:hypothetical protein
MSGKQREPSARRSGEEHSESGRKQVSPGRHEYQCTICSHNQREDIEHAFVNWEKPSRLAKKYSVSRDSIYRHAHALNLFEKRRRNLRAALERLIEKADDVEVNAAAVVSAVSALARINAKGEWVERTETVNVNALFDRMTAEELDTYAREGKSPEWFGEITGATKRDGPGGENER